MKAFYSTSIHATLLALLLSSSHLLLKHVYTNQHDSWAAMLKVEYPKIGLALTIYGFVFAYYIWALKYFPISLLYPIYTGLSVSFIAMAGYYFYAEPLSLYQIAGITFILVGVVLIGI